MLKEDEKQTDDYEVVSIYTSDNFISIPVDASLNVRWHEFIKCYNNLSVCQVQWNSRYKNIPRANKRQLLILAEEYKDYKAISNALRIASAGDGPYLEV